MDELQGERQDPAQESANGLLVSSADVDCFEPIDIPLPVVNGTILQGILFMTANLANLIFNVTCQDSNFILVCYSE